MEYPSFPVKREVSMFDVVCPHGLPWYHWFMDVWYVILAVPTYLCYKAVNNAVIHNLYKKLKKRKDDSVERHWANDI